MTRLGDLDCLGVCILFSFKGYGSGIYSLALLLAGRLSRICCDYGIYFFLMTLILLADEECFGAAVISCPGKLRCAPGMSRLRDHDCLCICIFCSFKGCRGCVYS